MKNAADKKAEENSKSQYLGEPGKWIEDLIVKIEKVIDLGDGDYGTRWMTIMKDDMGNVLNYFGYPKVDSGIDEKYEKRFSLRAKVKKHYVNKNGVKVTVVGYPKFIKEK